MESNLSTEKLAELKAQEKRLISEFQDAATHWSDCIAKDKLRSVTARAAAQCARIECELLTLRELIRMVK